MDYAVYTLHSCRQEQSITLNLIQFILFASIWLLQIKEHSSFCVNLYLKLDFSFNAFFDIK